MEAAVPEWAADYIGIPYLTRGRDRSGVDCLGLIHLIARERFGKVVPEYEGADWYKGQRPAVIGQSARAYAAKFERIDADVVETGDAILMRLLGQPFHVGMVLAPGVMIHTHEAAGVSIESYRSIAWRKRINGFYRY